MDKALGGRDGIYNNLNVIAVIIHDLFIFLFVIKILSVNPESDSQEIQPLVAGTLTGEKKMLIAKLSQSLSSSTQP